MLSSAFLDWWFNPWAYAAATPAGMPAITDRIGLRDGYRVWCTTAGISPDLPERFDPEWQVACAGSADELIASARLFAGLIAAREHSQDLLAVLSAGERKWCASVASTQPLRGISGNAATDNSGIDVRGLAELAGRLEQGFPGMWQRLRLALPASLAASADERLAVMEAVPAGSPAAIQRAQRCWGLCRQRARAE